MRSGSKVTVIIPALNEEEAIGRVLGDIPAWVDQVFVVDNGSSDRTAEVARSHGATVLHQPVRGYGNACLTAMAAMEDTDVVVFLDGDYSDHPDEMDRLVDPVLAGEADYTIGSRVLGSREPGALTPQARYGNWLSCTLVKYFWKEQFTDLGPFRAISFKALYMLGMCDPNYGWTIELQVKAARRGLKGLEVPVSYRRRIGRSKVSGTVKGVVFAGTKILYSIFMELFDQIFWRPGKEEKKRLILFTRLPEPGKTKTRMVPTLGEEGAAELQREMTEHAVRQARDSVAIMRPLSLEMRYEGGEERDMRRWLGPGLFYREQGQGDLGERMGSALKNAFAQEEGRAVLVGTDVPEVRPDLLRRSFIALLQSDMVLGPAMDGGYYLVGMNADASARAIPAIFENVPWGTSEVMEKTLQLADRAGVKYTLVDTLRDVDRPEDLHVWEESKPLHADGDIKISVIIPTINEEQCLGATLESVGRGENVELLVVDGGSSDGTVNVAKEAGARVIVTEEGRAAQMNTGAAEATGDVLLFLHADTLLPKRWEQHVRRALIDPAAVAGAFKLGIAGIGAGLRVVESLANWRSIRLHLPYGDQGIFVRAPVFRLVGGFPDLPLMEDYEIMRRLRRYGRISFVPYSVETSARRWESLGVVRTTILNQAIIVGFRLGVSPDRLALWYGDKK